MRRFAFALVTAGALLLSACGGGGEVPKIGAEDVTLGAANAPIEVIEYASASCSHCANWANDVFPEFKAKYIDTGKVRYTVREILTPPQAYAAAGFLLARCAGDERYYNVLEAVFRAQNVMFASNDMRGPLLDVALASQMTEEQFNACVSDAAAIEALNKRVIKNVQDTGRASTPQFFFDGKRVGEGELTMAQIDEAIAQSGK